MVFNAPDGQEADGYIFGLDNVRIQTLCPGDSNADGVFDSADFVHVFQIGEYKDDLAGNSTFAEGDWDGDSDIDSSDFVLAFQTGQYKVANRATLRGIAAAEDAFFSDLDSQRRLRGPSRG